jgi:ATP-dependent RNA helicase RhlE
LHRIGRTARAEASGDAISLYSQDEAAYLRDIEKLTGVAIPRQVVAGFEPAPGVPSRAPSEHSQRAGRVHVARAHHGRNAPHAAAAAASQKGKSSTHGAPRSHPAPKPHASGRRFRRRRGWKG